MRKLHAHSKALELTEKERLAEIERVRKRIEKNRRQRRERIAYNAKLKNHGLRVEKDKIIDFLERQPIAVLRHACEEARIFSLSIKSS